MGQDVVFRVEEAKYWKADVERITDSIQTVLEKIKGCVNECVDHMEDDEFYKKAFQNMWVSLGNAFDKLVQSFLEAVAQLGEAVIQIVAKADDIVSKIVEGVNKIRNR